MGNNGAGEFVGFKPYEVSGLYGNLADECGESLKFMCYQMQRFMDDLAYSWASPEGVTYSFNLADTFNKLTNDICKEFINIVNTVRAGAESWARTTGCEDVYPVKESYIRLNRSVIVSKTKDNINGLVGVVPGAPERSAEMLRDCIADPNLNFSLGLVKKMIDSEVAFCGANQQNNLRESLEYITNKCNNTAGEIVIEIQNKVKEVSEKYKVNATLLAQTFREAREPGSFSGLEKDSEGIYHLF